MKKRSERNTRIFGNVKIYMRNLSLDKISESWRLWEMKRVIRMNYLTPTALPSSLDIFNTLINRMRKSGCCEATDFQGTL